MKAVVENIYPGNWIKPRTKSDIDDLDSSNPHGSVSLLSLVLLCPISGDPSFSGAEGERAWKLMRAVPGYRDYDQDDSSSPVVSSLVLQVAGEYICWGK